MSGDAPTIPWVRLNAATCQDARLIRAGFWATAIWPAVIQMAKLHGWRGGKIPRAEFDAALLSHFMNGAVTDETVTRGVGSGIEGLIAQGLLEPDGAWLNIRNWAKYQSDPSNAERQERHRKRQASAPPVTLQALRNGSNGDGTGRDGTGEEPPLPPSDEGGSAAPSENGNGRPMRPREQRKLAEQERLERARSPEQLRATAEQLPEGVALHGGYVPNGQAIPEDAVPPSEQARSVLRMLRDAPKTPIRGPEPSLAAPPPKIADPAKLEAMKAEAMAKIRELEAAERAQQGG